MFEDVDVKNICLIVDLKMYHVYYKPKTITCWLNIDVSLILLQWVSF